VLLFTGFPALLLGGAPACRRDSLPCGVVDPEVGTDPGDRRAEGAMPVDPLRAGCQLPPVAIGRASLCGDGSDETGSSIVEASEVFTHCER